MSKVPYKVIAPFKGLDGRLIQPSSEPFYAAPESGEKLVRAGCLEALKEAPKAAVKTETTGLRKPESESEGEGDKGKKPEKKKGKK